MPKSSVLLAMAILGLSIVAPAADASREPLPGGSVGAIFVDAQGLASGQNLAARISEAEGAISGFTDLGLQTSVFDRVWVEGFSDAQKIQGAGSSSVTLAGSNAILALTDTTRPLLDVHALDGTTIHYRPASGVRATLADAAAGTVELRDADGRLLGTLVAFGHGSPAPRGETFAIQQGEILVRAAAGTEVVFLGGSDALHAALVAALAQGQLAALDVADSSSSALASFGGEVVARTRATEGGLATQVGSRLSGAAVLAYDLAYEALPATDASQVALYADGQLASRVASPEAVLAAAQHGLAAYFAQPRDGRVEVIISTGPLAGSDRSFELTAHAEASTQSGAHAEQQGDASSRAYGGFELQDNGKLTGRFSTSIVRRDALQLWGYTELAGNVEVFRNITIEGAAQAQPSSDGPRFALTGADATLAFVDDALATMTLCAQRTLDASFETAVDAQPRLVAPNVVALDGTQGRVGTLILAGGPGALDVSPSNVVHARLGAGATLVFRAAPDAYAGEDAFAQAIAAGRVGGQVLAGAQDGVLVASATAYGRLVTLGADASQRGAVDVRYASGAALAQAFALDARGASLAAKSAADIQVTVDGAAALPAGSLADALAQGSQARYWAETSSSGAVRVVVNTAAATGHEAHVVVSSKLSAAAKAAASTDAFGTFHLYDDGTAVGSFVTLKVDRDAGAVSGVTLAAAGQPVFASVATGGSAFASQGVDGASTLLLESREARVEFADTTSGFAKVVAKAPTTVAFRLAQGLHAEAKGEGVVELVTDGGRDVGSLVAGNLGAASGLVVSAPDAVQAKLDAGAQVVFKAHVGIESELSAAQRAMIAQAIAEGRVAGAVLVQTQRGLGAEARSAVRALESTSTDARDVGVAAAEQSSGLVTAAVTTSYYGDVQMVTAATQDRVDVTVASSQSTGRTILVSLDNATVRGMATGDAEILVDGVPAREASSYADILNPNDDNGAAEYFVLAGDSGTQVLVSLPHFSVHTVTLRERPAEANGAYMYATFALALVVVAESVLLYRRKKNND